MRIVTESEVESFDNVIILGDVSFANNVLPEYDELDDEGFILFSDGKHLVIRGGTDRGTLYGVYTFLEDYLGVRWFTPKLERVPESKNIIIDSHISRIIAPSFSIRRND